MVRSWMNKARWHAVSGLFCALMLSGGCGRQSLENVNEDGQADTLLLTTTQIRGFDPAMASDVASSQVIGLIYEGLLQYDYLARPYKLIPSLCEEMPHVSEDGLRYTFKIRKGVHFNDDPCFPEGKGREMVAADFVYSFKRLADTHTSAAGYWVFNGRIKGLDDFRDYSGTVDEADYSREVAGLQAPDSHTLVIELTAPYPQLLSVLAMSFTYCIPHEAVEYYKPSEEEEGEERDDFANHPVGTGPYLLKSWKRNYRLEFVANPVWVSGSRDERFVVPADAPPEMQKYSGLRLPLTPRIVRYVINDEATKWLMFINGELHLMPQISNDNWDAAIVDFELKPELMEKGIRLSREPRLSTQYIGFNMADPILGQNKNLRKAFSCAFNSEEWIKYNKQKVIQADGPLPPGIEGYVKKEAKHPFDLELAAQYLEKAGYKGGIDPATGKRLRFTIDIGGADSTIRERMELVVGFFEKLNIVVEPQYNTWPAFLEKSRNRQMQLFSLGWYIDYPDAENFLQLFYGPNGSPGSNRTNYKNPEFDALYDRIKVMQPGPERTRIYEQMADIIIEDCPWIFTDHPMAYVPYVESFRNYVHHDFPYGMDKYYSVEAVKK